MPEIKGEPLGRKIARQVREGKPQKQAVAIGFSQKRREIGRNNKISERVKKILIKSLTKDSR